MLAWAGVGVAMGGASPAAQSAADWIAPGVADDGAAVAIEKFVLT
jgi:hydroxymethylpyrimidine pyrophosphatase-like HAD family hydrolase